MPIKVYQKKLPVYSAPNQTSLAIMDCLSTCIFTLTPLLITYPFDFMWMFDSTRRKSLRQVAPISPSRHGREHSSCETKMSSWMRVINNEPLQSASCSWWWHFSPLPLFFLLILVRVSSQLLLSANCDTLSLSSRPLIFSIMNHASRREMLWSPQLVETMVTGDTQLLVTNTFITKRTFHPRWYVCDFPLGFFSREILPLSVKSQLILILLSMSV